MARSVFTSFHFQRDYWRVQQVLRMGALEGQEVLPAQDWESVKRRGTAAIQKWIDDQMKYKAAVVVLVGRETASRPWVQYEIEKAWSDRRPLVGIRIHALQDSNQKTDTAGASPFANITLQNGHTLDSYVALHNPSGLTSQAVHASIKANLSAWVANATKRT